MRFLALIGVLVAGFGMACADERPLLSVQGPKDLLRLEVRAGSEEVLWAIESDEPAPLGGVYYGAVPLGYRQTVPGEGRLPRPFVEHEPLQVLSFTPTRGFIHWATASGPAEISIYDSKTWVLSLEGEDFDVEEELENPPESDPVFVFDLED